MKAVLATTAVAVLASIVSSGGAQADVRPGEYVALGDSFASGLGAGSYVSGSGDCYQSTNSYPRRWARSHTDFTFQDKTCSGATIDDVRDEQMGALSEKTTLVTVTVGGNDIGFSNIASDCLIESEARCKYTTDLAAYVARHSLVGELSELYTDIQEAAPNARVVVMGYPRIIDQGTGSCGAATPTAANRKQMLHSADHLVEGIKEAVADAGVRFVEMRMSFEGHEACGADPYINGVDASKLNETFHPTAGGQGFYHWMLEAETAS